MCNFNRLSHNLADMSSATVNVRYIVNDVGAAVTWYVKHLVFALLSLLLCYRRGFH